MNDDGNRTTFPAIFLMVVLFMWTWQNEHRIDAAYERVAELEQRIERIERENDE